MRFKYFLSEIRSNISSFIWPRQKWLTDKIGRTWCDKPELIEIVLFEILVNYVEGEKCFECITWNHNEKYQEVAAFIRDCYDYIKIRRPIMVEDIDKIVHNGAFLPRGSDCNMTYEERYPNLDNLESELKERDQYYLTGIVKYKEFLWT